MRLGHFVEASPPPEVTFSVFVDGVEVGSGLPRDAAQRLYEEASGYVVLENQHGACFAYKGRGRMGEDDVEGEE